MAYNRPGREKAAREAAAGMLRRAVENRSPSG